jgi:hypothetical protein
MREPRVDRQCSPDLEGDIMNRGRNDTLPEYSIAEIADAQALLSVIESVLSDRKIDELLLRRGVWMYVGSARHAGTSPGHVIVALTELVEAAKIASVPARQAIMRQVILWCVEAYFGHLGGDVFGQDEEAFSDSPKLVAR